MLWKHLIFWFVFAVAELFFVAAISKPEECLRDMQNEVAADRAFFGSEVENSIVLRTNEAFDYLFVKTGIMDAIKKEAYVDEDQKKIVETFQGGTNTADSSNDILLSFFTNIYRTLYRLNVAFTWALPITIFLGAAFADGIATWLIRSRSFAISNTVMHNLSVHIAVLMTVFPALYILSPFRVHPLFFVVWAGLIAWPIIVALAHLQQISARNN